MTLGPASKRSMAEAFAVQLGTRGLGMAASMVTVALTTRYLGPESYGHLTTAIVFVGLWASLTELGIGAVIVRRATGGGGNLERLVRVNIGISVVYSLPLAALTAQTGWLVYRGSDEVTQMLLIISAGLTVTTLASCFEPVFLAYVKFRAVAAADLAGRLISLGATVFLVYYHADVVWFAVVQLAPPAAQLVIQYVAARRIIDVRPILSWSESVQLLSESASQTLVLIIAIAYWRADGVILSLVSTSEQVGVYGLAYSLAFTVTAVSTFYLSSTLSTTTSLFARDRDAFARFVERGVEAMLFIGVPIAVIGSLLSPHIVELIGSSEFVADGAPTLSLLCVAVAVSFLTSVISQAVFAAHDQAFLLRLNVANLAANIALNFILAGRFGAVGAGMALCTSEVIGLLVVSWRLSRRSPFRMSWLYMLRLLPSVLASAAVAYLLRDLLPVLVVVACAAGIYLISNLVIGPVKLGVVRQMMARNADAEDDSSVEASR
ncbi:flippase [Skermania piniformis]|uniref:flippase n=1 Tax=Skermania pinensis TaxID=39122 RepID=UPI001FE32CEE|nr:flippase [Skermania piniformis]